MDLFVVPTIGFELLYAFVIVRLDQRHGLDQRHSKPDGRMGCTSDNGGISLGMMPQNISSAIGTKSMAQLSPVDCAPWAFGTSLPHRLHPGRRASPNG